MNKGDSSKDEAGKNSEREFTAAYKRDADAIFRFCLVRTGNRETAIDITEDGFSRLWMMMRNGQTILNSRALIFKITRNLIIDWYRKKKPDSLEAILDEDEDERLLGDGQSFDSAVWGAEGRFLLEKIGRLPAPYQQAIYLRFVEGLSPPQIGEITGLSANAASVRINRGLAALRKITGYDL